MSSDWEQLEPVAIGNLTDNVFRVRTAANNPIGLVRYFPLTAQADSDGTATSSGSRLERLYDNIASLRTLSHPNLIRITDVRMLPDNAMVAMFMELTSGESLEKTIADKGPGLPEEDMQRYLKQICSALSYLHENNVIHRNLDTTNVIVTQEGRVKLMDYGLSVELMEGASTHPTHCQRGQPCYLAPELLQEDDTDCIPYSRGSDTWALGCIAYEMATGRKPYAECRNMNALVNKIRTLGAPELPESFSVQLRNFYSACTHMERKQRESATILMQHPFIN